MLGKSRRKTGVLLATATALAAGQTLANTSTALGVTVTGTTSNLATGATSTALAATENAAALNITVVGRKVLVVVVVLGYSSMTTNVGLSSIPVRIIVAICTILIPASQAIRLDKKCAKEADDIRVLVHVAADRVVRGRGQNSRPACPVHLVPWYLLLAELKAGGEQHCRGVDVVSPSYVVRRPARGGVVAAIAFGVVLETRQ